MGIGSLRGSITINQEEEKTMRNLMRMLIPIILVLSLSIFAQTQTGAGATAVEYDLILPGTIATVKDGFLPATVVLSIDDYYMVDPTDPIPQFFKGKVNIRWEIDNKTVDNIYDYTAYADPGKLSIYITTTGTAVLSGTFTIDDYGNLASISLTLQMPKDGITGRFSASQP
jgi:hypothetical protein